MNTPSPLVPKGSLEEQSRGGSRIRLTFITIVAIHIVVLGAFLIQGCRPDREKERDGLKAPEGGLVAPTENTTPLTPPTDSVITPPPSTALTSPPANSLVAPPPAPPTTLTPPTGAGSLLPPTGATPPVVDGAGSEHAIAKNETFGILAKKYGVSVKAIQEANPGVDSRKLKIGQKIKIPPAKPAGAPTAAPAGAGGPGPAPMAEAGSGTSYSVKSGDTLTKIARNHGTTLKALRAANNLRTDRLTVGQKLTLPAAKPRAAATAPVTVPPVAPPPAGGGLPTPVPFVPPPAPVTPPANP